MTSFHRTRVINLYRSLFKEAQKLPDTYLSQFVQARIRRGFRKNDKLENPDLIERDIKSGKRQLRQLQSANSGSRDAFNSIVELAFGRRGALRRQLLAPLIDEAKALQKQQPRLIPRVESSRPPAYPPTLKALLINGAARSTDPVTAARLQVPLTLPPRADPESEEAKNIGPLSLRRQVNIRRRFFGTQVEAVYPSMVVRHGSAGEVRGFDGKVRVLKGLGRRGVGDVSKKELFERLEGLAGGDSRSSSMTRRERRALGDKMPTTSAQNPPSTPRPAMLTIRSPRFLRRRFAVALGKTPILQLNEQKGKDPWYTVDRSPWAHVPGGGAAASARTPVARSEDLEWIRRAEVGRGGGVKKGRSGG